MSDLKSAIDLHRASTGDDPTVVIRAPGRVNLIGEHVDYHRGPVLPMAIDRALVVAASPLEGNRIVAHSALLGECAEGLLGDRSGLPVWASVLPLAAAALRREGITPTGIALTVCGDLPIGAGLSSSAAWIIAAVAALVEVSGSRLGGDALAALVPEIERAAFGVPCGTMDPLAVLGGRAGCALSIDTATGIAIPVPLPNSLAIALIDSGTRRSLDEGRYVERRRESEAAARALGRADLREATWTECSQLPAPLGDRARHVVSEIARVKEAVAALAAGDLPRFGELLGASHESLRGHYEVSNSALDAAVEIAGAHPAAFGARLTGAGFGGCAVAAIAAADADRFVAEVGSQLSARLGAGCNVSIVRPVDGAELLVPTRRPLGAPERGH